MKLDWPVLPDCDVKRPRVAVLLCTFNGAAYLAEQLKSIASQTHTNTQIWVSDDGSEDQTREILLSAAQHWGPERLKIIDGPRQGFARNFLFLACHPGIDADYFAFCDQDDIWLPGKLERALKQLQQDPDQTAALYGGTTRLVDATGRDLGTSSQPPRVLGFENALIQNVIGGNTMVFNQQLRNYLQRAGPDLNIVSHDWWLYILATAIGGKVIFDSQPEVCYRQHKDNLVGANARLGARLNRFRAMSTGRLIHWLWINCQCLQSINRDLPPEHQQLLNLLLEIRHQPRIKRLLMLPQLRLQRQSPLETWLVKMALLS